VTQLYDLRRPDEATVRAYLANRLPGGRTEAFEAYCLGHPEFAQRVEMDLYLRTGLRHVPPATALERTRPARRRLFAMAACLSAAAACGLLLLLRTHPLPLTAYRSATDVPVALLSGPRPDLTLVSLRARTAEHRVVVPAGAGVLTLRVLPDSPAGASGYALGVALESTMIARAVTVDKLKTDNDGFIAVYLPVAGIVGHRLRVTVTAAPPTGMPPLEFRLGVVSASGTPDETR
jgi:hypothetical protein